MASRTTGRMECLGGTPFLLILFAGLLHTVTKAEERITLDMAPNAVDDIFSNCHKEMMHNVESSLLKKELKENEEFAKLWKNNDKPCQKQIVNWTENHLTALQAYANERSGFRKKFNKMVHAKGNSTTDYKDEFPYKSLHFLLTDIIRLNNAKECRTVYYGTNNIYTATVGEEIRFGKFIHPRNKESDATEHIDDEGTLFNITSCSVVNVDSYACDSEEIDLLISPTEVFKVKDMRDISDDDRNYKAIYLTHTRFLSNHDCYLFPRTSPNLPGSSSPLLSSMFLAVMASIFSLYYCSVTQ